MATSRSVTQTVTAATSTPVTPDTTENVGEQTEAIVRNFFHQRLTMEMRDEGSELNMIATPHLTQMQPFTVDPLSPTATVGRRLAQIGDQINAQYENEFRQMISMLNITPSSAYEAFAGVARRLFVQGINWGRISALLMFGYRIAREMVIGVGDFMQRIIKGLVRFIISERIAEWIAQQGGWISALNFRIENQRFSNAVFAIAGISALVVLSAFVWSKNR